MAQAQKWGVILTPLLCAPVPRDKKSDSHRAFTVHSAESATTKISYIDGRVGGFHPYTAVVAGVGSKYAYNAMGKRPYSGSSSAGSGGRAYKVPKYTPVRRDIGRGALYRIPAAYSKELKWIDFSYDNKLLDTTGELWTNDSTEATLCRIPQGDGPQQRVGQKAFIRSISIRGFIKQSTFSNFSPSAEGFKVCLWLDKQANKTAPAYDDIYENGGGTTTYNSFHNLANAKRFKLLKEWNIKLNPTGSDGNGVTAVWCYEGYKIRWWKTFKTPLPIEYDVSAGTTGAQNTITSNNMFITAISQNDDDKFNFFGKVRLRYTD